MAPDHPLRLSRGNHRAGSGKGCAMNVISWEQGDVTITDFPSSVDRLLARVVQSINDSICRHEPYHANGDLCPECSITVLDLAHAIVGTAGHWSIVDWAEYFARIMLSSRATDYTNPFSPAYRVRVTREVLEAIATRQPLPQWAVMEAEAHPHIIGTTLDEATEMMVKAIVHDNIDYLSMVLLTLLTPMVAVTRAQWVRQWLSDAHFMAAPVNDDVKDRALKAMSQKRPYDCRINVDIAATKTAFVTAADTFKDFANFTGKVNYYVNYCYPAGITASAPVQYKFQNWAEAQIEEKTWVSLSVA